MKKVLLLLFILLSSFIYSQEKVAEFVTTHANVGLGVNKMKIRFDLYKDKLVFNYLDKSTIKAMKKSGLGSSLIMKHDFIKETNELSEWYKFENENLQIIIILKGNSNPSVSIKTKDSFTGKTTEQTYFSI